MTVGLKSADGSTREVTLTRSEIKVKSVYGRMEEGGIGYIRITNFNEETDRDFAATLGKLQEGMKALVLDLRDNPGAFSKVASMSQSTLFPKAPLFP